MVKPQQTSFGASIVTQNGQAEPGHDLPALTPAVSNDSITPSYMDHTVSPSSPFYQHPPASNEKVPAAYYASKTPLDISLVEKGSFLGSDLTPMSALDKNPFCSTVSVNTSKECTMWPSRQTLVTEKRQQKKADRASRCCACAGLRHKWEQLEKRQRLYIRVAMALILVGAMIGVGVGISKAVNGGYYYARTGNSVST